MGHGLVQCVKKIFGRKQNQKNASSRNELLDSVRGPNATRRLNGATTKLQPLPTVKLKDMPVPSSRTKAPRPQKTVTSSNVRLDWCGSTDIGMVRDHNEDYYFCYGIDDTGLFVVADGMGGHDAGEVASKLAVEMVCREMRARAEKQQMDPVTMIRESILRANKEVIREGMSKGSNMGTTLGVAFVTDDRAYVGSVGDSRVYWIENGSIKQVTEDHSLVAKLVKVGKITKDEARNHPKSNLLYRTIGSEEAVAVDTFEVNVRKGGCLLMCTDGLWGEVTDEDLHKVCVTEKDAKSACSKLIAMANENGGKDNITAVMVKIT